MSNAGTEAQIAAGQRGLADTSRSVEDILDDVIDTYYKPKNSATRQTLVDLFLRTEESYFGKWPKRSLASFTASPPASSSSGKAYLENLQAQQPISWNRCSATKVAANIARASKPYPARSHDGPKQVRRPRPHREHPPFDHRHADDAQHDCPRTAQKRPNTNQSCSTVRMAANDIVNLT